MTKRARTAFSVVTTALAVFGSGCSSSEAEAPYRSPAPAAATPTARDTAVPFQSGNAGFATGDTITVRSVRGDRSLIEVGGTYEVEGSWTLASQPAATLALYATNGDVEGSNHIRIQQGTGAFSLAARVAREGNLHVSLYPDKGGNSFGGVYFGTGANVYRGSYVPGP